MSNLGMYQTIVWAAKRCGGPGKLLLGVAVGGYAVLRCGEALVKKAVKAVRNYYSAKETGAKTNYTKFTVTSEGTSNEGLHFSVGDVFFVIEEDEDAILIEKDGAPDNPYVVSRELLTKISAFNH